MSDLKHCLWRFVLDMRLTKGVVLGILLGIATGLWIHAPDVESWTLQLSATGLALEIVFAVLSLRAVFYQIWRHRTFDRRWKALEADLDMAVQLEDFAWAEDCLTEMRVLYKEELGKDLVVERRAQ